MLLASLEDQYNCGEGMESCADDDRTRSEESFFSLNPSREEGNFYHSLVSKAFSFFCGDGFVSWLPIKLIVLLLSF
jgi:hypothetical protein